MGKNAEHSSNYKKEKPFKTLTLKYFKVDGVS
jgi:hypothetical protein